MNTKFATIAMIALMLVFATTSGCGDTKKVAKDKSTTKKTGADKKVDDHDHAHEGPHGGHLIELGGSEEYHAELAHDDKTNTVTIYLLGSNAKDKVTSAEKELTLNLTVAGKPLQFKLPAAPDEGDAAGESSRFQLSDASLLEAIEAEGAKGRLNVKIGDKSYSGDVEHHDH
jgi:hypothetical protein